MEYTIETRVKKCLCKSQNKSNYKGRRANMILKGEKISILVCCVLGSDIFF